MNAARIQIVAVLAIIVTVVCADALYGQSLADMARRDRERKSQAAAKGAKVYTNDDIPQATLAPAAPQPEAEAAEEGEEAAAPAAGAEAAPAPEEEKSQANLEKEYRDKFAQLRENLDRETQKLDVMQRELNLMQQQYYPDPQMALQQQYSRDDINKRTADIETQKANVEKAKQAITDLEDELRQKGLPPGWAR
jgi:hypothetical protein